MIGAVSIFIDVLCQAVPNAMLALSAGIVENGSGFALPDCTNVDFSRDVLALQPERFLGDAKTPRQGRRTWKPGPAPDTLKANK